MPYTVTELVRVQIRGEWRVLRPGQVIADEDAVEAGLAPPPHAPRVAVPERPAHAAAPPPARRRGRSSSSAPDDGEPKPHRRRTRGEHK